MILQALITHPTWLSMWWYQQSSSCKAIKLSCPARKMLRKCIPHLNFWIVTLFSKVPTCQISAHRCKVVNLTGKYIHSLDTTWICIGIVTGHWQAQLKQDSTVFLPCYPAPFFFSQFSSYQTLLHVPAPTVCPPPPTSLPHTHTGTHIPQIWSLLISFPQVGSPVPQHWKTWLSWIRPSHILPDSLCEPNTHG